MEETLNPDVQLEMIRGMLRTASQAVDAKDYARATGILKEAVKAMPSLGRDLPSDEKPDIKELNAQYTNISSRMEPHQMAPSPTRDTGDSKQNVLGLVR